MKIKKRDFYFGMFILIILVIVIFYLKFLKEKPKEISTNQENEKVLWLVDDNGYLDYPLDRGSVKFRRDNHSETESLTISKVIYQSARGDIYGLLVLPKFATELMPGVVLLPGAGVGKESELELAKKIAGLGVAVLTIDQRGVGETGGQFPTLEEDYASFLAGKEPYQHLMVYDALRAYDLLYSAPFVDSDRIVIAGESLGGRIAIIATAIDRNIKGTLVISSAGFDFKGGNDTNKDAFIKSIDSDHYIGLITPRKLVMMHNYNDKIISLNSAINSFSKAQEPKKFVLVNDTSCNHGYCNSMYDGLVEGLNFLVGIKSKMTASVKQ